jgi:hypothetical protein
MDLTIPEEVTGAVVSSRSILTSHAVLLVEHSVKDLCISGVNRKTY